MTLDIAHQVPCDRVEKPVSRRSSRSRLGPEQEPEWHCNGEAFGTPPLLALWVQQSWTLTKHVMHADARSAEGHLPSASGLSGQTQVCILLFTDIKLCMLSLLFH